jgi:hypothetical protein
VQQILYESYSCSARQEIHRMLWNSQVLSDMSVYVVDLKILKMLINSYIRMGAEIEKKP